MVVATGAGQETQGTVAGECTVASRRRAGQPVWARFGYRRITALLQGAGWRVGKDRVQRIWRREDLKVPAKQQPRLWLNGSCIRLRPQHQNHVWSYDLVEARTPDGRSLRPLTLIDEFTRECLAIRVARAAAQQRARNRTTGRVHAGARRAGARSF